MYDKKTKEYLMRQAALGYKPSLAGMADEDLDYVPSWSSRRRGQGQSTLWVIDSSGQKRQIDLDIPGIIYGENDDPEAISQRQSTRYLEIGNKSIPFYIDEKGRLLIRF